METPESNSSSHQGYPKVFGDIQWYRKGKGWRLFVLLGGTDVASAKVLPDLENQWVRIHLQFRSKNQEFDIEGKKVVVPNVKLDDLTQSAKYEIHRAVLQNIINRSEWKGFRFYMMVERHSLLYFYYTNSGVVEDNEYLPHKLKKTEKYVGFFVPIKCHEK